MPPMKPGQVLRIADFTIIILGRSRPNKWDCLVVSRCSPSTVATLSEPLHKAYTLVADCEPSSQLP